MNKLDEAKIIENSNAGVAQITLLMKEINGGLLSQLNVLTEEVCTLNLQIKLLREENIKLLEKNAALEAKYNKNSKNSSKPPSTDNNKKPSNTRQKTDRSTGGQPGHEGRTLLKIQNPDKFIAMKATACDCGCYLSDVEGKVNTRQVFELPKIAIEITEISTYEVICPICKKVHKTEFPASVTQPVQYGENLQALMVYLSNYQLIPLSRTAELISALTGQKISQGTIVNVTKNLYHKLESAEIAIKEQLIKADVLHSDETGMRSQGKINWVHSASTESFTHFAMHKKRGKQAAIDIGILPAFEGTLVHDHWKTYYFFTDCTHAECNAHHIRNLKGIHENFSHEWAQDMASLLVKIKRQIESLKDEGHSQMSENDIKVYELIYKEILEKGKLECFEKSSKVLSKRTGKPLKTNAQRLLEKLEKYDIETLSFMYDFNIPFDNNLAERDIRMVKLRQKISGSFRGDNGGDWFCRIRSYASTCRKNGLDVMESLVNAIKGDPFMPSID